MNSQGEQHANIQFCIRLCKLSMETIKLLIQVWVYAESVVHKWHSTFSKNPNETPLYEKKGGRPQTSIMEMNINTIRTVIDRDRHLSTRTLEVLLHILWLIIHYILTEKLEAVHVASTCVLHMLTSDQMRTHAESKSKFLDFIAEGLTYLNWVVTCDETWVHH